MNATATVKPATNKQINWIKDLLEQRAWSSDYRHKAVSRASTIRLMIDWAIKRDDKGVDGTPYVMDEIRKAMSSDLLGERVNAALAYVVDNHGASDGYEFCYKPFSSKDASNLIDWLKSMPIKGADPVIGTTEMAGETVEIQGTHITPVAEKAKPATDELEDGMYRVADGTIYKVYKTQRGHQVAKRLVVEENRHDETAGTVFTAHFEYEGKRPLRGLTAEQRMSYEEMKEFGAIYGSCCVCTRTLTDELSVYLGIGPVCGNREFGEAFKFTVKAARKELKDSKKEDEQPALEI
ncbi:gp41 [Mycobacterium phage PBI1]|uniref:Uncharacterized protein n=4 Tax=Plotvirus TaxID=2169613 RepID=B5U3I3_9CAUD|nr:gp41 [Mycobacterium phage PBI1]ABD58457.1 hypothetical protein PBI_PBI1_41 [Mycobacterium phage PBI1]ACD49627.1 hypothetical protein Adjutor_42 [Mycobacterium phage Adjutor]ACI06329.1 hypothetical protein BUTTERSCOTCH_41 [Mycobacterium phage Butterscotch]AVP43138.1 hypothetical protein PBI_BIGMAMA_40 [Mycobacterium phage BigMama]